MVADCGARLLVLALLCDPPPPPHHSLLQPLGGESRVVGDAPLLASERCASVL